MRLKTLVCGLAPALFLLALALILLAPAAAAQGNVILVDDDGGSSFTVLQDAVDAALEGDTILVKSGTYTRLVIDGKSVSVVADADAKVLIPGTVIGADGQYIVTRNLTGGAPVIHIQANNVDLDLNKCILAMLNAINRIVSEQSSQVESSGITS